MKTELKETIRTIVNLSTHPVKIIKLYQRIGLKNWEQPIFPMTWRKLIVELCRMEFFVKAIKTSAVPMYQDWYVWNGDFETVIEKDIKWDNDLGGMIEIDAKKEVY